MNKNCRSFIFGTALLVASSSVLADNAISKGVYVQGDIGYGEVNADAAGLSSDKNGVMGDFNIGYKFNPNFALEVGFAKFSNTSANLDMFDMGDKDYTTNNYYFDLAAKGIAPLSNNFDLFAKGGVALAHTEWQHYDITYSMWSHDYDYTQSGDSETKLVGYFGAGADFFITKNLALTLQGTTTTKSGDNVPAMFAGTLGLTYQFGN